LVTIAIEMVMLVLRIGQAGFLPPLTRLLPGDKLSLRVTFANMLIEAGDSPMTDRI